jgi:3-oxoacyl-[acyl-carrier-protein] synthase II
MEDAGLANIHEWDAERRDRVATVINTGGGGIEQVTMGADAFREKGGRFVSAFAIPALSPSMGACMVSMKYGLTGAAITQAAACATGVLAFQDALRLIRSGEADIVIAGGVEAPLLPMAFAALGNMGALSKRNDEPTRASRPFDKNRDGFLFGEGGAVFVVESLAHAHARNRRRLPYLCTRTNGTWRSGIHDQSDQGWWRAGHRCQLHRGARHQHATQ